jgi:hypothetical protein
MVNALPRWDISAIEDSGESTLVGWSFLRHGYELKLLCFDLTTSIVRSTSTDTGGDTDNQGLTCTFWLVMVSNFCKEPPALVLLHNLFGA